MATPAGGLLWGPESLGALVPRSGCHWHLEDTVRHCTKCSTTHRAWLTAKDYPVMNASGAEAEKGRGRIVAKIPAAGEGQVC